MKLVAVGSLLMGGAFALPSATTPSPIPLYNGVYNGVAFPSQSLFPVETSSPEVAAEPADDVMPDRCAVNDVNIWTRDNWENTQTSEWYRGWESANFVEGDHLDETFAGYWGLGPSFSCEIDNECKAPQCSGLKRPDQSSDYEHAAMVLASMANFNNHYARIWQALDGAKLDFATIQAKLQQTFYPSIASVDLAALQALNAGSVIMGLVSAWSGPASPFFNTAKELYGGVSRGISAILKAADASISNMAELASLFSERMDKVRGEFVAAHDGILKEGRFEDTTFSDVIEYGDYVSKSDIAILHDLSVEDLRTYIRNMFFAMIVNNAWIKQGAYIYSREMDEAACQAFKVRHDLLQHFCYEGRIYWLNKHHGTSFWGSTGIDKLPGMDDIEKELGAKLEDVLMSSIDAFNKGGYKYDASEDLDGMFDGDILSKIAEGSRYPGIWNIPVCEVESSDQFAETHLEGPDDYYWVDVDTNMPDDLDHEVALQLCLCATAKDRNGVSIMELANPGPGSFRALLDDEANQRCKLDDFHY